MAGDGLQGQYFLARPGPERDAVGAGRLTLASGDETDGIMEMLLAKKKAAERRVWLEEKGDLAIPE